MIELDSCEWEPDELEAIRAIQKSEKREKGMQKRAKNNKIERSSLKWWTNSVW